MIPKYPRINADRDRIHNFYLCEDVTVTLADGTTTLIKEGYRFDGHTIFPPFKGIFPAFDTDVYAALVHDHLLDTEMIHRYKRSFIDAEYKRFMEMPEYFATRIRRWLFPRVVSFFGFVKRTMWGL